MFVYFVATGDAAYVKVGITSNLKNRLRQLQHHHPTKLKLLKSFSHSDARAEERELLARFHDIRVEGEWLKSTPELQQYIESLKPAVRPSVELPFTVYANGLPGNAAQNRPVNEEEVALCRPWVQQNCFACCSYNEGLSSYSIKHIAERAVNHYISNGACITALFLEGFEGRALHRSLNVVFKVMVTEDALRQVNCTLY